MSRKKANVRMLGDRVQRADLSIASPPASSLAFSDSRRGSRQSRGYGAEWDKLRLVILKRDNYICQCEDCKALDRIRPANTVDHKIPKAQGGTDDPENLRAINVECHKLKTGREAHGR